MQTRQSPISSRKRSITTVRSEGTAPVAASCSRRNASRLRAASSSSAYSPAQPLESLLLRERNELARRGADRRAELDGPPHALALPERHGSRDAGRRRDEHAVPGDLLDPPGGSAEQEGLAGAGLVDHLLVQLADAAAALDELHRVEAAVRDRPRVRDRQAARPGAPADEACGAVPDDPRPQLGELVRGVAAGEHVEDVLELHAGEVGERVGAADELVQLVDRDLLVGADGHDLLGEHVERVAWDDRLLDLAGAHLARDDRGLEQVERGTSGRSGPSRRRRARARPSRSAAGRVRPTSAISTCTTRSTAPMSMPSSSEEVATRHGIWPSLSSSSISTRCSRASEPWWARAISFSASSLRRSASRSASRRLLTNTIVERCCSTSFRSSG